jgi:hypothetical protein
MQASPAKLPDDTWGVRVYDPAHAGDWTGQAVTVQAKSGKSWTSVLTELVSHNEVKGVALYRPAAKGAKAAPAPTPTLFAPAPLPPIAGGAPDEGEPTPKTGTFNPLKPDEPIAWDAPEAAPATTTDPAITRVTVGAVADLLKAAHAANPDISIPELAHAATAMALAEMAKGV